jgi:hypothetical protein
MMTRQGIHRAESGASPFSSAKPPVIHLTLTSHYPLTPLLTMTLVARTSVARTSALRRQVIQSRAFVPSRGVHDYKVRSLKL